MICPGPTHPPTHKPNHTTTHGWGIFHRFQIFKQNEIILISTSVIEFLLILGVPPKGGGRWVDWGGIGFWGCGKMPHALCTCTHACTHTPTCMFNMINMDASMLVAICNFYTCTHVCAYMYTCVGTPPMPPDTPTHLPPPQSHREPKTPKFNKS